MFLVYMFALVCSTSIFGMEEKNEESQFVKQLKVDKYEENEIRRKWQKKLYRPLNDYFDKKLSSKLAKRFGYLQAMLASEEHKEIKEQLAAEARDHYRRLAFYVDKETAESIRFSFSIDSSK